MVTRKIAFQQSQEIEKEKGCGLIEKMELSGTWVSGGMRHILLNEVPTAPGKWADTHFQLWRSRPISNLRKEKVVKLKLTMSKRQHQTEYAACSAHFYGAMTRAVGVRDWSR